MATSERWILLARKFLQSWSSSPRFGGGTNAYFYQLTVFHPPTEGLDFVCFSIHPQEHSFDNSSLTETLAMQRVVVENAKRVHRGLPAVISPITLKPRFNPNATGTDNPPSPGELPNQVDVRQMSLFGAVWTLGSLKYLSESAASSTTYYETTGWCGVMEREAGSLLPEKFRSLPGAVFPLYHVLADVGAFAGGEVVPARSVEPLKVNAIAICKDGKQRVLVGNMTGKRLQVCLSDLPDQVRVTTLDEASVLEAMIHPKEFRRREPVCKSTSRGALAIELLPYSITRIDAGCD